MPINIWGQSIDGNGSGSSSSSGNYVKKTGDIMSGVLNMNGKNINGLPTTALEMLDNTCACSYGLALSLLSAEDNNVVHKAGDTMTGSLLFNPPIGDSITLGCTSITTATTFELFLGKTTSNILCAYNVASDSQFDLKYNTDAFHIFIINGINRLIIGSGTTTSYNSLSMQSHKITDVTDPTSTQDAATKNYVDSANNLKVSKAGDNMTGTLNMGTNKISNVTDPVAVQDAATKNYVDYYDNLKVSKVGDAMTGTLNMSGNTISNVANPVNSGDAVNLTFLLGRQFKNNVGLIPILTDNTLNKFGYIAAASSVFSANYPAWKAFGALDPTTPYSDWATAGINSNFWLGIQLPVAKIIWKFQVTVRFFNQTINTWRVDGSNDGVTFTTLYTGATILVGAVSGSTMNEFILPTVPTTAYQYYRFYVLTSTGLNPGLCYFQLFSVDQIF